MICKGELFYLDEFACRFVQVGARLSRPGQRSHPVLQVGCQTCTHILVQAGVVV